MSQWLFLQGLSDVWQPMLGYFTWTRNSVPSAHMHSLYLSKPSSKYTSPAELGIRVALNMTDPLRMMLFSCKGTTQKPVRIMFVSLASHPPSHTQSLIYSGGQIPDLQPWARCRRPFWTPQFGPLCWRLHFRERWLCRPLLCSGHLQHYLWSALTESNNHDMQRISWLTFLTAPTALRKQAVKHFICSPYYTHPLCGSLLHTENFDSFGQMKLMVIEICAEECGLCARVREGYADITDNWGLVLLYAQFRGALLEHNLKKREKKMTFYMCT